MSRLDAHQTRGNEIMARSNEIMQANVRAFEANERVIEANARAFEDLRSFLGDLTLALKLLTDEFRAEMRAQREALFRILDRLDGQGEGGA